MARNKLSLAVLAGLVGAAAGLLFAPKSGKDTRKDLMKKMQSKRAPASLKTQRNPLATTAKTRPNDKQFLTVVTAALPGRLFICFHGTISLCQAKRKTQKKQRILLQRNGRGYCRHR